MLCYSRLKLHAALCIVFNGMQTPSAAADPVLECTIYATQDAGSMTMKILSNVDDLGSHSSQVQPLAHVCRACSQRLACVRCSCQLPSKSILQMSRPTCSWLLKGPADASHLYTQLYTLYVKGNIIGKLQQSLQCCQ